MRNTVTTLSSIKWGLLIVALWAVVLALLALGQLLILSVAVQIANQEQGPGQTQIWTSFIFNLLFLFGFGGSAYGLFRRRNWGRLLFLWCVVLWAGFNLLALSPLFAASQSYATGELIVNVVRYLAALLLPLAYLNLPWVKAIFYQNQSIENSTTEDTHDNTP